jgi:alpha-L-arabinofuranosidase
VDEVVQPPSLRRKLVPRRNQAHSTNGTFGTESRFVGHANLEWAQAPRLIEETYDVQDAVVFGNLLMSLLRHCDRVDVACVAQLVNVIAPIRADPGSAAWRQPTFYPFALAARYARGDVLRVHQACDTYPPAHGEAGVTDVVVTHDSASGDVTMFAVNRSETETAAMVVSLSWSSTYTSAVPISATPTLSMNPSESLPATAKVWRSATAC